MISESKSFKKLSSLVRAVDVDSLPDVIGFSKLFAWTTASLGSMDSTVCVTFDTSSTASMQILRRGFSGSSSSRITRLLGLHRCVLIVRSEQSRLCLVMALPSDALFAYLKRPLRSRLVRTDRFISSRKSKLISSCSLLSCCSFGSFRA